MRDVRTTMQLFDDDWNAHLQDILIKSNFAGPCAEYIKHKAQLSVNSFAIAHVKNIMKNNRKCRSFLKLNETFSDGLLFFCRVSCSKSLSLFTQTC